jgi:hypothetical protein
MVLDVIETHAKHAHRAAHHHLKKLVPGASGGMVFVCVALAIITCVAGVFWAYPNLMAPTKVRKVNVAEPPEHPLVKVAMGFSLGAIAGIFLVVLFVGGGLVYIVRFGSGLLSSKPASRSNQTVQTAQTSGGAAGGDPAVSNVNAASGSISSMGGRGAGGASGARGRGDSSGSTRGASGSTRGRGAGGVSDGAANGAGVAASGAGGGERVITNPKRTKRDTKSIIRLDPLGAGGLDLVGRPPHAPQGILQV